MSASQSTRPPFDPELAAALASSEVPFPSTVTPDMIPMMRENMAALDGRAIIAERGFAIDDVEVPGHDGEPVILSLIHKEGRTGTGPGIYHIHGGGMIVGDRFSGVDIALDWAEKFNGIIVSVEYRLAPEFPDPTPVEDCYTGLQWTSENTEALGIDPSQLLVVGASAGGGLSAGVTLLARDRKGPALCGSVLIYPMIDDRDATTSTFQIDGEGVWDRTSNITGWDALLGDRRGTDDVSIYAAPARATDLSGLPPTFIDCGSAEVFRDEDVAYASAIWAAGGIAELHVWPGGFHGFDGMVPQADLSQRMVSARTAWVERILQP